MSQPTHCPPAASLLDLHLDELHRHVNQCRAGRSPWFNTAARAERLHGVLAPRFVTTVLAAAALLWLTSVWP